MREHLWLPVEEYGEFPGTADELRRKLATTDPDVANALLDEAEKLAAEPHDRADGAERRATTLQGAVAIAASFGIASSALLLDPNKIKSEGWRQAFAVLSFGFVFCLVAAGFRAVGAVYRVHRWSYAAGDEIFDRAKMNECDAKTARAAALLRTLSRNQAIARWKVAHMRAAAWWFRIALLFLLAAAAVLVLYAFLGSRVPHITVPWAGSARVDHFYDRYLLVALAPLLLGWFVFSRRRSRRLGTGETAGQRAMIALLALGLAGALLIEWLVPSWRIQLVPLRHAGLMVALVGIAWIIWAYHELGSSYSSSTLPAAKHKLRCDGPYALVRHPMYLGMIVLSSVPSLIYSPGFAGVTFALLVASYWAARREEAALLTHDWARRSDLAPLRRLDLAPPSSDGGSTVRAFRSSSGRSQRGWDRGWSSSNGFVGIASGRGCRFASWRAGMVFIGVLCGRRSLRRCRRRARLRSGGRLRSWARIGR